MTSSDHPPTGPQPDRFSRSDKRWIAAQFVLLGTAGLAGVAEYILYGRNISLGGAWPTIALGVLLMAGSIAVIARAAKDLGDNLTAAPTPVASGKLVDSGIYGVVRHPMYLGLLLGAGGYALFVGSWLVAVLLPLLVIFFAAKSRHEEQLLRARIPGYADYARRVRSRFIPYIV